MTRLDRGAVVAAVIAASLLWVITLAKLVGAVAPLVLVGGHASTGI